MSRTLQTLPPEFAAMMRRILPRVGPGTVVEPPLVVVEPIPGVVILREVAR